MSDNNENKNFIFYNSQDGATKIQIIVEDETIWASQKMMADIFDVSIPSISKHLNNIYTEKELDKISTISKIEIVQIEGSRKVKRPVETYNLDAIIAVGYRVSSYKATQFRIWATKVLKEYMVKGFALDDERLKQGKTLFGKDYFDELLERIREIRASERRFYQKVTDIYIQCSYDYDKKSPITKNFFAHSQNKLEYAVINMTAGEIIQARADCNLPHMGLSTWANQKKGGKITKRDVTVAKNYLTEDEIKSLNRLVSMFLDYAENLAEKGTKMSMQDWHTKLDGFLQFNEYEVLSNYGKIKKKIADGIAIGEYEKFRPIQDRGYISDFDKAVGQIKTTGKLPKEI